MANSVLLPDGSYANKAVLYDTAGNVAGGTQEGIALASAARTGTTSSADLTNPAARGILAHLNITAGGGGTGIKLTVQGKDPISGNYTDLNAAPTAVTSGAIFLTYVVNPGAIATTAGPTQVSSVGVPRTFRIKVTHTDATSFTYSVGFQTLP